MCSNQNYEIVYKKHCNNKKMIVAMPKNWKEQTKSFFDPTKNGVYVKTGKEFNCFAINIFDLKKKEAQELYRLCIKDCNLVTKSGGTCQFYYKYDDHFDSSLSLNNEGFEVCSNSGFIIVPPSNPVIFIKTPEDIESFEHFNFIMERSCNDNNFTSPEDFQKSQEQIKIFQDIGFIFGSCNVAVAD